MDADDDSGSNASEMADFLGDFEASSDDGELNYAAEPEPEPEPERAARAAPAPTAAQSPGGEAAAPPPVAAVEAVDDDRGAEWTALRRAFQRSEAPRQVALRFARVPDWQSVDVQITLWEDVLAERMADGPGSREYVTGVLKAVVNACDNARVEVAERLLAELLSLQTGAAARKLAAERATLQEVESEAAAAAADEPAVVAASSSGGECTSSNLATQRPRYAQEEGPEAWAVACLPCPEEAQRLRCVRKPSAVSKDEIEALLSMLPLMREAGAGVQKRTGLAAAGAGGRASRSEPGAVANDDPSAWVTTYLHTNQLFQTRFAELFNRLRKLALDTDDEHWGIRRACEAGNSGAVRTRVIEVHEAGPGAGLAADKHYDSGSIVTLDVLLSPTDDFEGGQLQMMEPDGTKTRCVRCCSRHFAASGSGSVFFSSRRFEIRISSVSDRRHCTCSD
jgi:hypothetical protein